MALETGTYIDDFVTTNPAGADDRSTADDHLRLIKTFVKATFPNITGAMTATHVELNKLAGATPTTAQLNFVTGVTSSIQTQIDGIESSGTWTPAIQDSSFSDGEGQTYTERKGTYTRIGDRVFISGSVWLSAKGTGSGSVYINGLPFDNILETANTSGITCSASNLAVTAGESTDGIIHNNQGFITLMLYDATSGGTELQFSELTDLTRIHFSGSYITDA